MKKSEFEKGLLFSLFVCQLLLLSHIFKRDIELILLGIFMALVIIGWISWTWVD